MCSGQQRERKCRVLQYLDGGLEFLELLHGRDLNTEDLLVIEAGIATVVIVGIVVRSWVVLGTERIKGDLLSLDVVVGLLKWLRVGGAQYREGQCDGDGQKAHGCFVLC